MSVCLCRCVCLWRVGNHSHSISIDINAELDETFQFLKLRNISEMRECVEVLLKRESESRFV